MGAGQVLLQAIEELKRLPLNAPERGIAIPPLVVLRLALPEGATRTDDEQELVMSTMEIYERWKQQVEGEGEKQGIVLGEARGLALLTRQFERRLARTLTDAEQLTLRQRLDTLGATRLGDVVLDLEGAALSHWLTDPDAR